MWSVLLIIYGLILLYFLRKVLFQVKSPPKTLSWILVLILLPMIGILLYMIIGRSPKKDKLFEINKPFHNKANEIYREELIPKRKVRLAKLLHQNNSAALSYNNEVRVLNDGKETFADLLNTIKHAKHSIHLDYYIIEGGKLLDQLIDILEERIKQGVVVRLIYDGFGSFDLDSSYLIKLEDIGVQLANFMSFNIIEALSYINYRNHRKIAIIDNHIAYTGGLNISDKYFGSDQNSGVWRDTYVRVEGEAAQDFERVFYSDWLHAGKQAYHLPENGASSSTLGSTVQIVSSGPDSEYKGILHEYFTIITDAEDYVYIVTPYFIPGNAILTALKTSALSDIDVRLMLPLKSDSRWLKWCMFTYLEELLAAGVRIYLYQERFLHSKIIISDDIVSSIGTANVDERSFDTNFEINAIIYDENACKELKDIFFDDINACEELSLSTFNNRADRNKLMESIARLTSPIL